MTTFTSVTNGNLADGATYGNTSPGSRGTDFPGDDDVLVVDTGDTVTMNADATIGSVDIKGTLTTDGTARTLTLDDGGQGYICEHRGTVSTTINLTINSNYAGNRLIRLNNGGNGNFNDVSITLESSARVLEYVQNTTIDGDLTINVGEFQHYSSTYSLDVQGDCIINNTGKLDGGAGSIELRSLTINSGGTYSATSGTTTITGKESGACFANSGTFTHNKGKVSFTKSGGTWTTISNSGGQSFYDVNVDSSTGTGIYANDPLTINNNFTLVRGTFIANDAGSHDGDITVHGLTSIGGGANATKLENDGRTLQLENVTVLSNGTIDVAEGTNNFGGIRNVGGTIS